MTGALDCAPHVNAAVIAEKKTKSPLRLLVCEENMRLGRKFRGSDLIGEFPQFEMIVKLPLN